jgi:uncharacterized membrane protein YgcG
MTEKRGLDGGALSDNAAEALLAGRAEPDRPLAGALAELRAGAARPAPEPSAALVALLARAAAADQLSKRRSRRRAIVIGVAVAGTSSLALSGVAAAHDALPAPAQGVISGIIDTLTPFRVNDHHGRTEPDPPARPTDARPSAPHNVVVPVLPGSGGADDGRAGRHDVVSPRPSSAGGSAGEDSGDRSGSGRGSRGGGSDGSGDGSSSPSAGSPGDGSGGGDHGGSGGGSDGGGSGGSSGGGSDSGSGGGGSDSGSGGGGSDGGSGGGGSGSGGSGG